MTSELPQVRRRPQRALLAASQRDSNTVRASVLETALELGLGQNSTVANWIFNNPLSEESEDPREEPDELAQLETRPEPALDVAEEVAASFASGSNSTSDESSSLHSPGNIPPSSVITTIQAHVRKPTATEPPHVHFDDFPADQLQLLSPFTLSLHDARHQDSKDNSSAKDTDRSHSQDDSFHGNPSRESPCPGPADSGYNSEGQYLSKGKAPKGKDKHGRAKGNKSSKHKALDITKTSEKDADYASDGGYLSASSNKSQGKSSGNVRSRAMAFFRRRPRKSVHGSDDDDEDIIPPVPAIPVLPRPSSPRPLERRAAPSSPRPGFSPLSLNLTSPTASPSKRRVSKSPPPHARTASPQRSDHSSGSHQAISPVVVSVSPPTLLTPAAVAATVPLPPSIPGTPLSTASFPSVSSASSRSLPAQSSRQHLGIPPPTPPPTLPLPQPPPPPSPSLLPNGLSLTAPPTPSRRVPPARPIPHAPMTAGSTQSVTGSKIASPFRPLLSARSFSGEALQGRKRDSPNSFQVDRLNSKGPATRQRLGPASTPAFLQRRIQHGPPPSPRHPPPDVPLPLSPDPVPNTGPRAPIVSSSKFHEHFSSVSSMSWSQITSTLPSMSPSPSTVTLSEMSSGPSIRSSHVSSVSERGRDRAFLDSSNVSVNTHRTTSETSSEQRVESRSSVYPNSQLSYRTGTSPSILSEAMQREDSVSVYDDDDADVDEAKTKSYVGEEDDDVSVYPSEEKTAGRRTMYLVEHGELDENGEMVSASDSWNNGEAYPPVPPLPPIIPGPGYF